VRQSEPIPVPRAEPHLFAADVRDTVSRRRLQRELTSVFVVLPTLLVVVRYLGGKVPVIPTLIAVSAVILYLLLRSKSFDRCRLWKRDRLSAELARILLIALPSFALLALYTARLEPDLWLEMPTRHPGTWAYLVLLYPLLSVLPQELIYRLFFFHRYHVLFPRRGWMIAASAILFGYAHLVFGNGLSVILSTCGGTLFSWTYLRTRSLWITAMEHSLYGCFLFTIGLGRYFYAGNL